MYGNSLNANAFKICFWLLAYLLNKSEELRAVRREIASSIVDHEINFDGLLQCRLLNAAFDETLRLASAASSARTVISSTCIQGKMLQPGEKLLMPYRQLHLEEEVFGPHAREFDARRFVDNEGLSGSQYFKPFGGGTTYCSGRYLARREVIAFVALVLSQYELELEDPDQMFPRQDEKKPTLGVLSPLPGDDLLVVVRPRMV